MPKGRQKVDRLAVAQANGYVRGTNREKDQHHCETFYADGSITLQERVLSDYIVWASQEDENLREGGLREGQPVPDLATIKDFIRFYIFSSHGMISLRPTKSSVLNFAERFFAGFTRLTKSTFDTKDTRDVYKWIRKSLVKEDVIEDITRAKHMFTHCDLKNIIVSIWKDDDPVFIHPRYRVQLTFAVLIYCYSGARIGTFIPDTSKKDQRGLRYEDIELYIYRRPDGEIELFFRLSERWVKNNDNPKNTVFRVAMREHGKLRFNPVPWLLEMAVQDGAFLHFDSLETLKNWNPDNNEPIPLLWRPSVAREPVLRQVTRFGGLSNSAWTRECFCRLFRAVVVNAGYPEIITIHTLRRGLANRLDKVATESERSQILTQKDPNVFGRSYIDSTSAVSSMDAFLGETMRLDHIEYLRGVGKYRAIGYPRRLPAEREHAIAKNEDLRELERRLKELQIQENCNQCNDQSTAEESDANNESETNRVDEDSGFAIKLTRKQIQVLKTRLHNSELAKYREEWIQKRVETQVRAGGKAPEAVVYNDVAHCLFKAQPDRQRVADMMPMDNHLSYQDMLSVVESLLAYCTKDYDVFYRPGEEPVDGRCPVSKCDLTQLTRPKRSNHVQDCQRKQRCKVLGYEDAQLKYCYECFAFYTAQEWEDHCRMHIENGMSRRCEIITYCYTLVRPGYCPFCLGTESLSPSDRMRSWKRSNELRSHVINDMKVMCGKYICSHPMCRVEFDSETQLRYHLSDTHGLQKAIWVASGHESDSKGKLGTRADAVSRGKKRSQEWKGDRKGDKKRQRLDPHGAGMFSIIQWAPPAVKITTMSAGRHSSEVERHPDAFTLLEHNQTGLTPVQVVERRRPVPSPSTLSATPFPHVGEKSFSSAEERLDQICEAVPRYNADGIECSTQSPSLQPDSIADTSNTSDLPTLYTGDKLGSSSRSSSTNTSPEIVPIDPQLTQNCNSPIFVAHEPGTSEDGERSDSSYATGSPGPGTSPTSLKLKDVRQSRREAIPSADTTVSPVSANLEASPALTTASAEKALRNTRRRTVDNEGVHASHRLTRAMARRQATESQSCPISKPKSTRAANHLSKEEEIASISRGCYVTQQSSRVTRSTFRTCTRQ
ncbi:hypothetical protein IFM61392_09507 [Aspergillus lentulus]|nr:hypothetical protein IFM61392_09507 [Aspergillus lentulus]